MLGETKALNRKNAAEIVIYCEQLEGITENRNRSAFYSVHNRQNHRRVRNMLTEIKTSCYEPLYTLTEAEKIIDLQRARRSRNQKRVIICFIKQRICGVLLIVLGCVVTVIDNTAGMAAIVCIAIGIGLIITRQIVMMFRR